MSIRSIIEINHDCLHELERLSHDELIELIRRATDCNRKLSDSDGNGVRHQCGITTLSQRHHSSAVELIVDDHVAFHQPRSRAL